MTVLMVPALEDEAEEPWPTLGPQVARHIREELVFGPGDLFGQPAQLTQEFEALLWRMYEVQPPVLVERRRKTIIKTPNPRAGKRRFKRVVIELPKGTAKTERGAWIAEVELDPDGPVRCDGFRGGEPVGRPIVDPYIPMLAYTEEQSDTLAYAALKAILEECDRGRQFEVYERAVIRKGGRGSAVSLATSPNARDGARTTFQLFDETHRWTLARQHQAHRTMLNNIPKRPLADPWTLEITTAYSPGEGSIAEQAFDMAEAISLSKHKDPAFFFFARWASDEHDIDTEDGLRSAIVEARGPEDAQWADIPAIMGIFNDPNADIAYEERVWLNRRRQSRAQAFNVDQWGKLAVKGYRPPPGALVVLGFDGSVWDDATGLVGCEVETGIEFVLGAWENPGTTHGQDQSWKVPEGDVDATVAQAFADFEVWRMYCDPYHWEGWIAKWQGEFGETVVVRWPTTLPRKMAYALDLFKEAMFTEETGRQLRHDGDATMTRHVGNAVRNETRFEDPDTGKKIWTIRKERPDSPRKIDLAMAAVLAWQCRVDAIAAGARTRHHGIFLGGGEEEEDA